MLATVLPLVIGPSYLEKSCFINLFFCRPKIQISVKLA